MGMKHPPHPGRSIKDACLDPLDLTVTEGVVGVASADRPAARERARDFDLGRVRAGEAAALKLAQADSAGARAPVLDNIRAVDAREIARKLSWREGYLTFTGEPLSEALAQISRYTPLRLDLADAELGAIRVGGKFPLDKTDGMLGALETNFGLHATRIGENRVVLSAAE